MSWGFLSFSLSFPESDELLDDEDELEDEDEEDESLFLFSLSSLTLS
jgi:hypothetical protein